ncbi:5789_t:CDS:2, partial [Racocetra fulgida]
IASELDTKNNTTITVEIERILTDVYKKLTAEINTKITNELSTCLSEINTELNDNLLPKSKKSIHMMLAMPLRINNIEEACYNNFALVNASIEALQNGLIQHYVITRRNQPIDANQQSVSNHSEASNRFHISSSRTPSILGEPEEWYKRQKTNAVDAISSSSIPVSLLCSVFRKFKDLYDELSESEDNLFAYDFCIEMAKHYNYESVHNCRTDGTVYYGDGPNAYREVNVEYKKHNCSSEACPYLENCGYYLTFCAEKEEHSSYHVPNFPCFLIVISGIVINLVDMSLSEFATNFTFLGPYFFVSGAVFADVAIVDPLTPVFPLMWQKYDKAMMVSIAKTFRALKISLRLLDQYYANVDELIQDEPQTVHPMHPSFPEVIIDNKSYMVQIDSQVSTNLLWEVTLLNEQGPHLTAYVKAVKKDRYSLDTHKLLAEVGYAPEVYTTSIIPGNWILVYMEYLNNHSILNNIISNLDDQKRNSLRKKIKGIVEYLHNLGYIHRDLREGNILVYQLEGNEFDVKLIDFEWSGKVGSACYSPFMNRKTIQWPDGAEDWKLVTKNHDLF